jgi:glycosyltransferase involved in cell wall biosynthesis
MKTSIYITDVRIGEGTGGGIVAENESKALGSVTLLTKILSGEDLNPLKYGLPPSPFLYDYIASNIVQYTFVDIAHVYGGTFTLAVNMLKRNGAKIYVTVPAHNLELSVEEHKRWIGTYPYHHMVDPFLSRIYFQYIKDADVVICPSRRSADYIRNRLKLSVEPIIIPHGCNPPKEVKPFPEKFDVAYVGQAGPDKGLPYLILAWSKLNLPNETLIIAGADPAVVSLYLSGARGNYHVPGYVRDVSEIFDKCSVYVQPSVTEGFGIPVLEAMAHGRPVIVSEGAGVSEIVDDGRDGFVVPIRDPDAIADRIMYFRDNPSELARFGRNARMKAEMYTWERVRKMYEEVYVEGC